MQTLKPATRTRLQDQVLGCWYGKTIGGTLGAPVEGDRSVLSVTDYPPLHGEALPNDDLDLQLLWLATLERHGLATDAHRLSKAWLDHVRFPYGEYGYALRNLRRGLLPPLSGSFDNPFTHGMGSPIRTEIWAVVAHGRPHLAAALAFEDARVDHAGEGLWGSVLWAALEAAAFVESDPQRLLSESLALIPATSRVALAVRQVQTDHQQGLPWLETRQRILERYGNFDDFTDAPQNIAFAVLGWLYGRDFGEAVLLTVNCGFDTDSSGAMVGALLGILVGAEALPERWKKPLGLSVVVSPEVGGFHTPATLDELSERCLSVSRLLEVQLEADTPLAQFYRTRATAEGVRAFCNADPNTVVWSAALETATGCGVDVSLHYPAGPSLDPDGSLALEVRLLNHSSWPWSGKLRLLAPTGLVVVRGVENGEYEVQLEPDAQVSLAFSVRFEATSGFLAGPLVAQLELEESHHGVLWQRKHYPVAVVRRRPWQLSLAGHPPDAPPLWSGWLEGGRLELNTLLNPVPHGEVVARTTLCLETRREVRVVVMAHVPIEVSLGGEPLFTTDGTAPLFPSPHITRHAEFQGCYADLTLEPGEHSFELRFSAQLEDGSPAVLEFMVAGQLEPRHHHFVDVLGL